MKTFREIELETLDVFFNTAIDAEDAECDTGSGTPIPCEVKIREQSTVSGDVSDRFKSATAMIKGRRDQIEDPKAGYKFLINGSIWRIAEVIGKTRTTWRALAIRNERFGMK